MAQPPSTKRIDKQDVPTLPDAERLLEPLNRFMGAVGNALASGLTFRENFRAEWRALPVVEGQLPDAFAVAFRQPVRGVTVQRVEVRQGARPAAAVWLDWEPTTLQVAGTQAYGVKPLAVHGLAPGSAVTLHLLVVAE